MTDAEDDKIGKLKTQLLEVVTADKADTQNNEAIKAARAAQIRELRTNLTKELAKETIADKLIPWIMLIAVGPLLIFIVGAITKIHPFDRGDFYIYDIGLLLAGTAEAVTPREISHRRRQAITVVAILLGIALAIFWGATETGGSSGLGARWWVAIIITLITGIIA